MRLQQLIGVACRQLGRLLRWTMRWQAAGPNLAPHIRKATAYAGNALRKLDHCASVLLDAGEFAQTVTAPLACRVCVLAGDISPIDVITHLPVLCEDNDIPYIYVPSKDVRFPCLLACQCHISPVGTEQSCVQHRCCTLLVLGRSCGALMPLLSQSTSQGSAGLR